MHQAAAWHLGVNMLPKGRRRSVPDPFPPRWPKIALIATCLAASASGWWFYGDGAEAAKPAELQQAELLSTTNRESLQTERGRSRELEQELATHQNDQQLLAQERERIKELEQLLAESQQPPPAQPTTDPDPHSATPTLRPSKGIIKPQPIVRRTGPRPLPNITQPMPRFSLQASDLTYNPAGYWQVTVTLTSNTPRTLDTQVQCSFLSTGRSVGEGSFGPTAVAPGEQISTDLIGPPMTAHVDSTICGLVEQ